MAQDSDEPSGATLGYLAPICVAIFFIFIWIIFGTRQRFRAPNRQLDPEGWPLGFSHTILTSTDLESRFPSMKYSAWSTAHRVEHETDKEIELDPSTSQAPLSPSRTRSSRSSLDAAAKEVRVSTERSREPVEKGVASNNDGVSHMECAICMEDFDDDDSIRALTCGHIFHATCLDPWFTKRQARCPLCKTCYPPEHAQAPLRPPAALIRNQIFPRVL
ncbi:putative RING finger protein [Aspergillus undulatus]|uniref:putative RING finger protein n=1 Tax=Aspergillus undulatus TaxID=1810928 RepID=UPI003CCDE5BB